MNFAVHPTAEAQALKAAAWYDKRNPGKGDDFLRELQAVYGIIENYPAIHQRVVAPKSREEFRVHVMKRFQYSVYFRVRFDELRVVAVVHQSRRSSYWARNLP